MRIHVRKDVGDYDWAYQLNLGVQTNPGKVEQVMHWKAKVWAPMKAKSYTIKSFRHTDYYGRDVDGETGYASFTVSYFTTKKEGKHHV